MKKTTLLHAALSAALVSALLAGCIEDGNVTGSPSKEMAVRFSTSISKTRVHGNVWEPGDQIGVWMIPASSSDWSDPDSAPLGSNMLYGHDSEIASDRVVFSGIGEENILVWPDEGNVDFAACYPYLAEGIEGSVYPVDISDQESQSAIDLMYSDNAANLNVSSGNPTLSFEHRLTKLVFNIEDAGGVSLEAMTSVFEGLPVTASFDLATGEMIEGEEGEAEPFAGFLASLFDADEDGAKESAVVEAIVLPGTDLDYTLTFTLSNGETAVFTPSDALVSYEGGKRYIYNISLKRDPVGVVFGNADGELESIVDWSDVEEDDPYEIPKDDGPGESDPFSGEKGEVWSSGTLSSASGSYSVIHEGIMNEQGTGITFTSGQLTILKEDYEGGVASVSVTVQTNFAGEGTISSVTVDGTPFLCDDNDSASVPLTKDNAFQGREFVFTAPESKLFSGDIRITIERSAGSIIVGSFKVN